MWSTSAVTVRPASCFWCAAMVRLTVLPAAGIVTLDTVTPGATGDADTVFISVAADGTVALLTTDCICTPSSNCCMHSHSHNVVCVDSRSHTRHK